MPKWVRSFRVWRVSSQRIRSADFSASTARGVRSERLPMGVPTMRSLPGTRRSLLQASLRGGDRALELVRQHDQHLGELLRTGPLRLGVIEKEIQLIGHAAGELGDAGESERTARALQLVRDEEKLGKRGLELRFKPETVLTHADGGRVDVLEVVALQRPEVLGHERVPSEIDALSVSLCVLCG